MKKIVRTNLTAQISSYLQDEILKGTWKPGEKIPSENELAESLGVSRMSLRNAIQRCNAIGLTETRVGEGTFVRDFNLRSYFSELYHMRLLGDNPNEINDLRSILQIGSIRLAFTDGVSQEEISQLEMLGKQMEQAAADNDLDAFHKADIQFHRSACRLCHNKLLYSIYDAVEFLLDGTTRTNVEHSVQMASGFSNVLSHHHEMLESIRTQDIDRFVKAMMESRERSRRYYENN
ncbi:MAG: GntR family transcriptional regulator [Clostridiales bacterium]|nr:GntR family transcriptional regulator [Clostridiales bacterium]